MFCKSTAKTLVNMFSNFRSFFIYMVVAFYYGVIDVRIFQLGSYFYFVTTLCARKIDNQQCCSFRVSGLDYKWS